MCNSLVLQDTFSIVVNRPKLMGEISSFPDPIETQLAPATSKHKLKVHLHQPKDLPSPNQVDLQLQPFSMVNLNPWERPAVCRANQITL